MNSEIRYVCVFAAGVITGAGVALLFAPQPGWRTRRLIRRKGEDVRDAIQEAGEELRVKTRAIAGAAHRH